MTPRRAWAVVAVVVTLVLVMSLYGNLDTGRARIERRLDRLDRRLDQLERRDLDNRYLLCQIADQAGIDGDPRPCLDDHGRAVNARPR